MKLQVLMLVEHKLWVAQCLEPDVAAQGITISDALESLALHLDAICVEDAEHKLRGNPAPVWYFERFREGQLVENLNLDWEYRDVTSAQRPEPIEVEVRLMPQTETPA